jgi:hypothetical protein
MFTMRNVFSGLIILAALATAQNTGIVKGRVVDKTTKQPLLGANVFIPGSETGTTTDEDGVYLLENLAEDVYKLEYQYLGYATFVETDVRVVRGKTTTVREIELSEVAVTAEGITVAAGYFREDDFAPVSTHSYSREEIYRAPGASGDIFRAIETLPGVSTSGGEFSAFSVRSGSPKDNIILVDNIPFDKVSHFNGGASEEQEKQGGRFSIFAPNLIEEANFQAGGFSAVYGGKKASYLDLRLKEGNTESMTADARYDITGWELNYDGPMPGLAGTGLVISARNTNFTDILQLTGQKEFGRPRFQDYIVKTSTRLDARHKISLLGIYTPEQFDREIQHVLETEDFAGNDITDFAENKGLIGLNWQYLSGKRSVWQNSFYHRRTDRDGRLGRVVVKNNQDPATFAPRWVLDETNRETESGWRSVFTWMPTDRLTLTSGVEASQLSIDYQRVQNGLDTVYVFDQYDFRPDPEQKYVLNPAAAVNANFDDRRNVLAAFSEFSLKALPRLSLNMGLRYDYNEFNRNNYFAPRFSAIYKLAANTRINLATGIYYQTPELALLLRSSENNDLKNERAVHYIAGFTHYLSSELKFTVEGYYKQFDDLLVRNGRSNQVFTNSGFGWARGVDFSLVRRFASAFYGQVTYSYAESRRNDDNGAGYYDSDFNQPHIFNILAGYQFDQEWSLSAKWRYATGRPKDTYIIHSDIFNDPGFTRYSQEITANNAGRLPDFHTLNIRVDYRKQLGPVALVSFIDIVNVYNHLNVNEERFQQVNGPIDSRGFGILPTMGIKIEY